MAQICFVFFVVLVMPSSCIARDSLSDGSPVIDNQSETTDGLISAGGRFAFGFFTPTATSSSDGRRYVGIWYHHLYPKTVVWVANRGSPVPANATGAVGIKDNNLCVFDDATGKKYWSTKIEEKSLKLKKMVLTITDSGNLVLWNPVSNITIWQSFLNPTDTFLPGMRMMESLKLSSWRQVDDPEIGSFSLKQDDGDATRIIVFKESTAYWSMSLSSQSLSSSVILPSVISDLLSNFSKNSSAYQYTRLVILPTGEVKGLIWSKLLNRWIQFWSEPSHECRLANRCGDFGICDVDNGALICKCMPGFKPMFADKWSSGNYADGCTREAKICSGKERDTFQKFKAAKIGKPDMQILLVNTEVGCMNACLDDCRCVAYTFVTNSSFCWEWFTELNNLQEGRLYKDYNNISVRVSASYLGNTTDQEPLKRRKKSLLSRIVVAVVITSIFVASIIYFSVWMRRNVRRRKDQTSGEESDSETRVLKELMEIKEDENGLHVHFIDFQTLLDATGNFSVANKLGEGGYGPVYKGKLPEGQEIAIKRLSRVSRQGLQEFKNEVMLIARLQHRNLVRLRGYCMKGEEKILVYEFMPNKSLDFFIFGNTRSVVLTWEMRSNIILGIARGLLYLHQDSRLRIIHRDMKCSNILLDGEMNPKIADFGLARIIGGNASQAITSKIAGTCGYMSPETLGGTFSVKSDVFSFGVVLLEIISGRKNSGFNWSGHTSSLLGYAWDLYGCDKLLDLLDKHLDKHGCLSQQVVKYATVGLLCVQQDPTDRPTISTVITLLEGEAIIPPTPKQPAFVTRIRRRNSSTAPVQESNNELTTSSLEGR